MKVPYNWLKEYIDIKLSLEEIAEKLTMSGLEVADIQRLSNLDEPVLDIEVTANRGDCLSIIGIAREIETLTNKHVKYPQALKKCSANKEIEKLIDISIKDTSLCSRYAGRIIRNVKIEPSPSWLANRLKAVNIRPINNIVDITNYVLMETGQPLHAFDYNKISGKQITIRRARQNESIVALDESKRQLSRDMLVIADKKVPIAIAGIMGGIGSEIDKQTTDIFLESACFHAGCIRKTSKTLELSSESSYRFERGVDPNGVVSALNRAAYLIEKTAHGKSVKGIVDIYPKKFNKQNIQLRIQQIKRILGIDIPKNKLKHIMLNLGFEIKQDSLNNIKVLVPTYRQDIRREIDLIEEIARIYGYNNIDTTMPRGQTSSCGKGEFEKQTDALKNILSSCGMAEIYTSSFTNSENLDKTGLSSDGVKITNPLGDDQNIMRTSLIPEMLSVIKRNLNRSLSEIKLYELGQVFFENNSSYHEKTYLCCGIVGNVSFFDIKGILETILYRLGIEDHCLYYKKHQVFTSDCSASIDIQGRNIGIIGEISSNVLEKYNIDEKVFLLEIGFSNLSKYINLSPVFKAVPKYPASERDIAFTIKENVSNADIMNIMWKAGGEIVEDVKLFDIYRGKQILSGHKSMAYSICYRSNKKTLTDEEVNQAHSRIGRKLISQLDITLRK
ncbi:MAG: phenylalanine--tRNA ligase subunit beta [bacterium]|nr:phenylalanine--tRNA ligase subunit beta [bacterium]